MPTPVHPQPAEFYAHVTHSMQYLDTKLPAGSSVVFLGLVDGRVLWDTMYGMWQLTACLLLLLLHPSLPHEATSVCHAAQPCTPLTSAAVASCIVSSLKSDRTHPIGVPYRDLYTFLSCNGANPCWGWLNANETWRNITTQRAEALNAVYPKVIANQKYKNFDMHFNNPDWRKFINAYVQAGGLAHELIEYVR